MGDCVSYLFWREPNVDGVKYCAHHWDGEVGFEVAVRVHVNHCNLPALPYAELFEARSQSLDPLIESGPSVPVLPVDDLSRAVSQKSLFEKLRDRQPVIMKHLSLGLT